MEISHGIKLGVGLCVRPARSCFSVGLRPFGYPVFEALGLWIPK